MPDRATSRYLFGFGNVAAFRMPSSPKPQDRRTYLASADFNSDGNPDMVAVNTNANAVMMFTSNFQGKLTAIGAFLVPNLTGSLSVNDFDGDGNLDLLVPDTDSGSGVVLLGRGDA